MQDSQTSPIKQHERMMRVEKYIEENLDAELSVDLLSEIACYSRFHFHRLFKASFGQGIHAYKKRLLLERSVAQLLYSSEPITQVAHAAGYDNQASYNKAFRKMYDTTPSICRQQKLSFTKTRYVIQERKLMKVEMRTLKTVKVLRVRKRGGYADSAAEAWGTLMPFMYGKRLMGADIQRFGVSHDDPTVTDPDNIRYDACVSCDQDVTPEGEICWDKVDGGLYAVFKHEGAYENLGDTYQQIFQYWLPESGYQLRDAPLFDKYLNRDPRKTKPENLKTEIHIPVLKR